MSLGTNGHLWMYYIDSYLSQIGICIFIIPKFHIPCLIDIKVIVI